MKIGSLFGMCSWVKALGVIQCMRQIDFATLRLNLITIRFLFTRLIDKDEDDDDEDNGDIFLKCIIYNMLLIFI